MNPENPKVFISYSWSSTDRVEKFAQRLKDNNVDVIIDKWALKPGNDKYAFMERCVTDETVSKVLIMCDKAYAEKADGRKGGVGDETAIISAEVYGKAEQEKFIPIILERDDEGKEYCPAYLKSRIYIDFSSQEKYEENYESLLRNLHNKPQFSKPALGKMPEWLNEEKTDFSPIRRINRHLQHCDGKNKRKIESLCNAFHAEFATALRLLSPDKENIEATLLSQIDVEKPLRDLFVDYIATLMPLGIDIGDELGNAFEYIYNNICATESSSGYFQGEFEFAFYCIWELVICCVAVLVYHERYQDLFTWLHRTYFLRKYAFGSIGEKAETFQNFYFCSEIIESHIKPRSEYKNHYSLSAEILVKREYPPMLTKETLAAADCILHQLSIALSSQSLRWIPKAYCYFSGEELPIWSRMVSRRHCEKLLPLFGIQTIGELKELYDISNPDRRYGYPCSFHVVPTMQSCIKRDEIATLP